MRQICESCHPAGQLAAVHPANADDCVACHMPSRRAVDVSHAAVTDHRMTKRPTPAQATRTDSSTAWYDPAPELKDRNLGLALFNVARKRQSGADFEESFRLLSKLPELQKDAAVEAAEGYLLLGSGHARAAVGCFQRAVTTHPESGEYWLDLGVARESAGDADAAVEAFRRSIADDPYDYRAYRALSDLYKHTNRSEQAQAVTKEFLRLVPQSILMRFPQ